MIEARNICEKISWTFIVIVAFTLSGVYIGEAFYSWINTPLQTTIDVHEGGNIPILMSLPQMIPFLLFHSFNAE